MKRFNTYLIEKLKVSKIKVVYHPKSKEELLDLIIKEIEVNGSNCSLNHIDVSHIDDMSYLFLGGSEEYWKDHPVLSAFDGDISDWDVSNVTNMEYMFYRCKYSGKNGDISDWDVSHVTNMRCMFGDSNFNGDISNWDVSNVTDMNLMFYHCESFNQDISLWDVSNVIKMEAMFYGCESFNQDISSWNVSNVELFRYIFSKCPIEEKYKPKFK